MSVNNIVTRIVQPGEFEFVAKFIIDYFQKDEPLGSIEPENKSNESDAKDITKFLKHGTSILAVQINENDEEELVGVNIGVPKEPAAIEKYSECAAKEGNTINDKIMQLIGVANRQADLFNRYGVDKLLYSFMICVKPSCRGKRIGIRLMEELMALAKQMGYKLVSADCTSFYAAQLCKRMGWDVVNFIAYNDYKDANGEQIFKPPPPHEGLTTLAVRI